VIKVEDMSVVLLAGGLGTRISEESHLKPKPMIEIGGRPILWHIMKLFSHYNCRNFVICLGYRGYVVKEYFSNYFLHSSDLTIDALSNDVTYHSSEAEPWRITMIDTGLDSMTGGRLRRVADYLPDDRPFFMTYGDGVADVDIESLFKFHIAHNREATLTAVIPPGRFGALTLEGDRVRSFNEKPPGDSGLINGGYFILEKSVINRIGGDDTVWEKGPLEGLAGDGELMAYHHNGFWQPMDTLRDKIQLESMWDEGSPPWKVWP
tara:strand:- start:9868 stop:10659 length:792 start_codon:yes stop_codon:yes gene_type:complete